MNLGMPPPPIGSRWTHKRRGSLAVVLRIDGDVVTFRFPAAQRNPAKGTGRWPSGCFLAAFAPAVPPTLREADS